MSKPRRAIETELDGLSKALGDEPTDSQQAVNDPDQNFIQELAVLSPMEYDRRRKAAAKQLGWRVSTLDELVNAVRIETKQAADDIKDPIPCAEAVAGSALLDKIAAVVQRYLILPKAAPIVLALWVVLTYIIDAVDCLPILAVRSPEKRCGKTTLLDILSCLVCRPLTSSNISGPALYRSIGKWHPTLLIDELDSFAEDKDELRGILNSGHTRATAFVIRCEGENQEPTRFTTWAPKVLALIGKLPGTVEDRSIAIAMKRKTRKESVQRFRESLFRTEADELRSQLARWAVDHAETVKAKDPVMPEELHDRDQDNWRALFAIAEVAGGEWIKRAKDAALQLAGVDGASADSTRAQLLQDIKAIFGDKAEPETKLSSETIVEHLVAMEDRPWPEWGKQKKPLSKTGLAALLKPFDIQPDGVRIGDKTPRGYCRKQFDEAFERYLPLDSPVQSATVPQPTPVVDSSPISGCNTKNDVAVENSSNSQKTKERCTVCS